MSFTPVHKVSAYEAIVEQIEAAIEGGEFQPGDRLPGERKLMADFSVSRATIREALRVLQATGVIESRPGDPRGPVISAFSPRLLEKSLSQISRHGGSSRVELLQFRLFLEGSSAHLAALHRTAEQLAEITDAWTAMHDAVESGKLQDYPAHVQRYHDGIRTASGNRLLAACGGVISDIMGDLMARRIDEDHDAEALLRRAVTDGAVSLERIRERDASGARAAHAAGIFRFYEGSLSASEQQSLNALV